MGILVIGSVALDTVETPFGKIQDGLGGSATHFSASASYYTDVHLVAVVGEDFPSEHIAFLKSRGIDVEGLEKVPGKTFRWAGKYDYDLSNAQTLSTDLNVFEKFSPQVPSGFANIPYVFLANIDPVLQGQVISQVKSPKLIACDTMNFWIQGKKDDLINTIRKVNLLTINEGEARLLSGQSNLLKAAKAIQSLGPKTLVIKRGEYGALLFHEGHVFSAPGLPLEDVKDPTGAGDSFAGGFMGYIAKNDNQTLDTLKQAVIFGSVMASYNVEAFSCDRLRNLTQADIQTRYRQFKNLAHFEEVL